MSYLKCSILCIHMCIFLAGTVRGHGRLITSLLGAPAQCSHGRSTYACTFSLTCWLNGGSGQSGCGPHTWLVTCCVYARSSVSMSTSPTHHHVRSPSNVHSVLRKRVDDISNIVHVSHECGVSKDNRFIQKRIIGGMEARFGQFPWQAYIRISAYQCGGVLVSKKFVATAAHCIVRARTHDITVYLGELDTQDTGQVNEPAPAEKYRVTKIIIHPQFEYRLSQPDRFDIALLRLSGSSRSHHISPICLPQDDVTQKAGRLAVVAGWGKMMPTAEQPGTNILRSATVPILDTKECISWHRTKHIDVELFPEMLCAGHADGHQDACLGDSGGPLITKQGGRWTLVGITSAGFGCGEPRQPGIYHSVGATVSWIRRIIEL